MTKSRPKSRSKSRPKIRIGAKLGNTVAKQTDASKIVTPRLIAHLAQHRDDPLSRSTAKWLEKEVSSRKPSRSNRCGASSAGMCDRAQVFGYLGAPARPVDTDLASLYDNGTWSHRRMQTRLLEADILLEAEWKCSINRYRPLNVSGSMDGRGRVPDDHQNQDWQGQYFGFEFKTANTFVWQNYANLNEPASAYYKQVARYFLMHPTLKLFVVLIEDKNTQALIEQVIERDKFNDQIAQQHQELLRLRDYMISKNLPPQLIPCAAHKGQDFKECPYGGSTANICATAQRFRDVLSPVL